MVEARHIKTVIDVWEEWHVGAEGRPSILDLNREYGASWRQSTKTRNTYSRRKRLIEEIKLRAEEAGGRPYIEVVNEVENIRRAGDRHGPHSINWMMENWVAEKRSLRKARQGGGEGEGGQFT